MAPRLVCRFVGLIAAACALHPDRSAPAGTVGSARGASLLVAHNALAAVTSRVDQLLPAGATGFDLTGRGVLVGEWDVAGVRTTHLDLIGRVGSRDAAGVTDHSTHVAGTLVGAGVSEPLARGMAPLASVWSQDWTLDLAEMRELAPYLAVSTHAYGDALGWGQDPACPDMASWLGEAGEREDRDFGRYGMKASAIDAIVNETDLLMVWAGGNERQDVGVPAGSAHRHFPDCASEHLDEHDAELVLEYDTMGGQLAAKNALVVGAAAPIPAGPSDPADVVPLAFSSYGPMDDGRIKPDLLASGAHVLSTVAAADDAYERFSGTSASAAVVAGGVALLTEHVRNLLERDLKAHEWRALLVHTAMATVADGRPTYQVGFGLFDARAAADLIAADAAAAGGRRHLQLGTIRDRTVHDRVSADVAAGTPVRVTLAWTDPPGAPSTADTDDPAPALVNDLDLVLVAPDGDTVFRSWSLSGTAPAEPAVRTGNHVDTLEVVDVPGNENVWTGRWTARVEMAERPYRLRPQSYALASSMPTAALAAPVLAVRRQLLVEAEVGTSPAPVELAVGNLGSGPLAWSAAETAPWLELGRASGDAADKLELAFDSESLAVGDHLTTVIVDAGDAGRSTLGLVLRVRCSAECAGRTCGSDPACGTPCGACDAGEACDASGQCVPLDPGCPGVDLGTSTGMLVALGTTEASGDDDHASCGGEGSDDVTFTWRPPDPGLYRFSTAGSALDTVLYVRDGCGGSELACSDDTGGSASSVTLPFETIDAVQITVDGEGGSGPFQLHIARAPCPQAELGSRTGPASYEGNLNEVDDTWDPSCGGADDRDVTLAWTAVAGGAYTFTAEGAASITALASCGGAVLACAAAGSGSAVTVELEAGQSVVLAIELEPPYDLRLAVLAATGACRGSCEGSPNGGACFCDPACVELGDCCESACELCGACCVPRCEGLSCGADGCGGGCGSCGAGERCDEGQCVADACAALADGAACDDGSACTRDDACIGGRCAGRQVGCAVGERCDPETGACVRPDDPLPSTGGRGTGTRCPLQPGGSGPCTVDAVATGNVLADGGPDETVDRNRGGCACASVRRAAPAHHAGLPWLVLALVLHTRRRRRSGRARPVPV